MVTAYPTVADLLEEWKRSETETLALLENLPDDFVQRKSSFWRLAYNMLQGTPHYYDHLEQMKAAVAASHHT
jgi:hypothetical protein